MDKFASPQDFLAELRELTAYCEVGLPCRVHIATKLVELAARVAGDHVEAMEFPTQKALETYLKKHPKADPSKHTVRDKSKGKDEPKKDDKPKEKGPVTQYDHADVRDLAQSFRNLDKRKTRMEGLLNSKRLIDHYYKGNAAKEMHEAIDKMIEEEKKNPRPLGLEHHRYDPGK